jgi:hypothetical protein
LIFAGYCVAIIVGKGFIVDRVEFDIQVLSDAGSLILKNIETDGISSGPLAQLV